MLRRLIGITARAVWNGACFGLPRGETLSRYGMYNKIRQQLSNHNLGDSVLSISHSNYLAKLLGADVSIVTEANYPDHPINRLPFPDNSFSAVVSDQVLEHIECSPTEAVAEVKRVLRPGGIAVHTTCFMLPYHGSQDYADITDGDYWRYTPSGLARLHKDFSEVLVADGWGNPWLPLVGALGLTFVRVPEASWHPFNRFALANRPSYASLVWVAARK